MDCQWHPRPQSTLLYKRPNTCGPSGIGPELTPPPGRWIGAPLIWLSDSPHGICPPFPYKLLFLFVWLCRTNPFWTTNTLKLENILRTESIQTFSQEFVGCHRLTRNILIVYNMEYSALESRHSSGYSYMKEEFRVFFMSHIIHAKNFRVISDNHLI
jgi:hypothetical protein